ncbi:histidine kinase-like ATPase [Gigaspora rosea]|uniref:histidine kinase n=1 Tax=Gigaspora rosea TaxID=44941 RepID=A0A397VR46_9GLOM|nr:histidine kinase-like ATPase [Gigaspora rosea]
MIFFENASILSAEIKLNNDILGWIKAYRPSNSIWLVSEIELLQQISNQISLAINHNNSLDETAETANIAKSQILANASHGAIVGIISSLKHVALTDDQKDMINIMSCASDIVLSIINDILDAARLEAQNVVLMNRTFYLSNLLEGTIEKYGKKANDKKIELILNCDVDVVSRYVKSDPERVKFTDKEFIDENEGNPTYGQILKKENLLFELYDTGIGIDPKFEQNAWKSFSQGDMSITKRQDGTGLGLSICKSLVEINGGEIKAEKKRSLVIHRVESMRNAMLKYLKKIKKIDAFTPLTKELVQPKDNEADVMKAILELRGLEINHNNLVTIFIAFPSNKVNEVAEKLIRRAEGTASKSIIGVCGLRVQSDRSSARCKGPDYYQSDLLENDTTSNDYHDTSVLAPYHPWS